MSRSNVGFSVPKVSLWFVHAHLCNLPAQDR
jgi:hypothetical protein